MSDRKVAAATAAGISLPVRLPRRYKALERLGVGGMGEVFRTLDRLSGQIVALKRVVQSPPPAPAAAPETSEAVTQALPAHEPAASSATTLPTAAATAQKQAALLRQRRVSIANEFRTLASLRHPSIISVLDYGFDQDGSPFFTMELLPEQQPFTAAAAGRKLPELVAMVGQLLAALSYLHRHGILHRDLKPSNVLCIGTRVKVLDFGVAARAAHTRDVAGTLEYMAPELLLGNPPSPASDLYALGVLLWEAFTGEYPFSRHSVTHFLSDVLGEGDPEALPEHVRPLLSRPRWTALKAHADEPPPPPRDAMRVPVVLREIVLRLLQRDPLLRYQSAEAVAQALSQSTGIALHGVLASTHESLLTAAPLLGRSAEVAWLHQLLAATQKGHGSLVLLGGESGVGKSRLLDELRILALVEGAQVVRGQAVSEGKSPLHELAEVLRLLSLYVDLDDDSAAVLKELIPDLPALLQRKVADAPALDSQAAQQRLLAAVEAVLLQVRVPTVLLLEDLHWAATETITLLQRLQPQLPTQPLLIVASYRDDERPELMQELPGAELRPVRRLGAEAVGALAAAVLGPSGEDPELQRHLLRESEGNALFLIEITRALAEESGGLTGAPFGARLSALPVGVRALLQRRLQRVPAAAQKWLKLTAIAGRQVELALLAALCPEPENFLTTCAEAGVLEVHEERWRFSHDKLREALLSELDAKELQQLHKTVAEAITALHGQDSLHAAALLYHYDLAGVPARALHYGLQAGEHALRRGALVEATQILQHAVQLLPRAAASPLQAAHAHRLLAQSLAGLGRTAACAKECQLGLRALGRSIPQHPGVLAVGVIGQAAGQLRRRLRASAPPLHGAVALPDRGARLEEAELLALVGEASFYSLQQLQMVYCMLGSSNAAEDVGATERQVFGYSGLALVLSATPLRALSASYFARAEALLQRCHPPEPRAELELRRVRALVYASAGKLRTALHESELAVAGATRLHDDRLRMFSLLVRRMASLHLADFAAALRDGAEIQRLAQAAGNAQQLTWAHAINAMVRLRRGDLGEAHLDLAEAATHAAVAQDQVARCAVDSLRAQLLLRRGDYERSAELLHPALATMNRAKLTLPGILVCFRVILEVAYSLQQKQNDPALGTGLRQMVRQLGRYSRSNIVAQPAAALWQGRLLQEQGDELAAVRSLRQALALAQELQMPYDQAEVHQALAWLGRTAKTQAAIKALSPRETQEHLAAARQLYARLQVTKPWGMPAE